tara:strand:- start:2518 stop:2667 length:150 start_codon:yes stop_codon:yes gene_type:complete
MAALTGWGAFAAPATMFNRLIDKSRLRVCVIRNDHQTECELRGNRERHD